MNDHATSPIKMQLDEHICSPHTPAFSFLFNLRFYPDHWVMPSSLVRIFLPQVTLPGNALTHMPEMCLPGDSKHSQVVSEKMRINPDALKQSPTEIPLAAGGICEPENTSYHEEKCFPLQIGSWDEQPRCVFLLHPQHFWLWPVHHHSQTKARIHEPFFLPAR